MLPDLFFLRFFSQLLRRAQREVSSRGREHGFGQRFKRFGPEKQKFLFVGIEHKQVFGKTCGPGGVFLFQRRFCLAVKGAGSSRHGQNVQGLLAGREVAVKMQGIAVEPADVLIEVHATLP